MADLYLLTRDDIPKKLRGGYAGYAVRLVQPREAVAIEDRLFRQGETAKVPRGVHTLVLPDITWDPIRLTEYQTLAEFALALLTVSGHASFFLGAAFSNGTCTHAKSFASSEAATTALQFVTTIRGEAVAQWIRRSVLAYRNASDRIQITADRYLRYIRSNKTGDALLDLCISLESLLDASTEILFRFGLSLAKITGERGPKAEALAGLLSRLYEVRSKIVHGDPQATRLLERLRPELPALHELARRILTLYILYMSDNSRENWKCHVRANQFA